MEKKVIVVAKKTKDFFCTKCGRMVDVKLGKPWTIETDKVIYKTWDYGHRHDKIFRLYGKDQYPVSEDELALEFS